MQVCIHRGTHQIGGSCVEIESHGMRMVLDVGLPLDAELADTPLPPSSGLTWQDDSLLGIFISHPHIDHYGLMPKVSVEVPTLIGSDALRILEAAQKFVHNDVVFDHTIPIRDRAPIELGPFKLTPYLVDHSAYDAYAVLIEADGQRLFYSGDFRGHGRKGTLFDRLVSCPPKNVDVLLMEGSTLGRANFQDKYPSESELEDIFIELFRQTDGIALVWCSGQNIDRLVTVYRACRQAKRQFVADMYTACILRDIKNPRLPQPGWSGFRVYLPWAQKQGIIKNQLFDLARSFSHCRIYPEELEDAASRSVMLFRPSMRKDLERADCLKNARLVYSLWPGYLEREQYRPLKEWLDQHSIPLVHCHTSGHAPLSELKRLAEAINPKVLVPIHTFQPEEYHDHFKNVLLKDDGEWWGIPH